MEVQSLGIVAHEFWLYMLYIQVYKSWSIVPTYCSHRLDKYAMCLNEIGFESEKRITRVRSNRVISHNSVAPWNTRSLPTSHSDIAIHRGTLYKSNISKHSKILCCWCHKCHAAAGGECQGRSRCLGYKLNESENTLYIRHGLRYGSKMLELRIHSNFGIRLSHL